MTVEAPQCLVIMRCPKCKASFKVDAYLGAAMHENCKDEGTDMFLIPIGLSVEHQQANALALGDRKGMPHR